MKKKIEYYGFRVIVNKWFASHLSNRKQTVLLNSYKSNFADDNCWVLQGLIIGPLLFLIYINDLHLAIKYSKVPYSYFVDDTDLLIIL